MALAELCHIEVTDFREQFGTPSYPVEDDRYWLFTSRLCPFAHRTEIMRSLKNAEQRIGLTITGSIQTENGWNLDDRYESPTSAPSPIAGTTHLPDIYEIASPGYSGRVSVPVLFDTHSKQIVNNESAEIIRQFDQAFGTPNQFYPFENQQEIDAFTTRLASEFIDKIYHAGFALNQDVHRQAVEKVFAFLDELELLLSDGRRFVIGDQLTVADVHAFPHLCRFDSVYHSLYRLNLRFVGEYQMISEYMNRLVEYRAFKETFDIESMKSGYFLSWNQPTGGHYVPLGPKVDAPTGLAVGTG